MLGVRPTASIRLFSCSGIEAKSGCRTTDWGTARPWAQSHASRQSTAYRFANTQLPASSAYSLNSWLINPSELLGRTLHIFQHECGVWIGRLPEEGNAGGRGHGLLEQLQPFAFQGEVQRGESGEIAARACEAGDETRSNRVTAGRHHDGDRAGRVLSRLRRWRPPRHDDINHEPNQVGGEVREQLGPLLGPAVLDGKILSLDVAKLAETCAEGVERRPVYRRKNAYPVGLPGCCASAASGAKKIARARARMDPIILSRIVVSSVWRWVAYALAASTLGCGVVLRASGSLDVMTSDG